MDPQEDVRTQFVSLFVRTLVGEETAAGVVDVCELARNGNPFPFIADRWPFLLITDPEEGKYFKGAIGDPLDPCLRLDDWQREDVLRPMFDDSYFSLVVKGNTKAGKGTATAIGINVWFDIWSECKVIVTSQQVEHAKRVLLAEVAKWRKLMRVAGPGRILERGIADTDQHYVLVSNPLTGEGFSGQHGARTLFVLDEASAIDSGRFEDAEKQARKIVALGNPRTLSGWFFAAFRGAQPVDRSQDIPSAMGKRRCVTIDGADLMNVRNKRIEVPVSPHGGIEIDGVWFPPMARIPDAAWRKVRPLIPEQCDYGRYQGILQHPDSRHVDVFAHGRFPKEDPEKQVILPSWLDRHHQAHSRIKGKIHVTCFAFDAARSLDGDASVLAGGSDDGCAGLESWRWADLMYHGQRILEVANNRFGVDLKRGRNPVCVDMVGLGAGTGDWLRSQGVWVIEYRGNDTSEEDPRTYANLRAESYAMLGRRLSPDDQWRDQAWPFPYDQETDEDICAPEKLYEKRDALRFRLEPKEQIKLKLGRSPDRGDTLVMLWHAIRIYSGAKAYLATSQNLQIVHWPPLPKPGESGYVEPEAVVERWWNS